MKKKTCGNEIKIEELLPSFSNYIDILKKELKSLKIYLLKPEEIKDFVDEIFQIYEKFSQNNLDNMKILMDLFDMFNQKTANVSYFIPPLLLRALNEDVKKGGEIGHKMMKIMQLPKEIARFYQDEVTEDEKKMMEALRIIRDLTITLDQVDKIPLSIKEDFVELVKDQKSPIFTEFDANQLVQTIKRTHESCKYINGFFLAIFDFISNKFQKNIEKNYFNPKFSPFNNFYFYSKNRNPTRNPNRKNLPCLKDYLTKIFSFPGINGIIEWMMKKTTFYRNKESHNLDNVVQDKIKDGIYAFYSEKGIEYVPIEKLRMLQHDLYQIFLIIRAANTFYSMKILNIYISEMSKNKIAIEQIMKILKSRMQNIKDE